VTVLRHVVLIFLKPGTSPEVAETIVTELRKLPSEIPAIRDYEVGWPTVSGEGVIPVVGLFDDLDGYQEYMDHPAHRAVGATHIVPAMDSVQIVQFEV
jgi:hypothetical protein